MEENYYDILGVNKESSDEEIKKAYRKLALIHHPDKNGGDDTMFKKINAAHDTLTDPEKRQIYDNPEPEFPAMFSGNNMFEKLFREMTGMNSRPRVIKRNNILYRVSIKLSDIHFGLSKSLKIKLNKICFDCQQKCSNCKGSGNIMKVQQNGPFIQHIQTKCRLCNGTGSVNKKNASCNQCGGNGKYETYETLNFTVPKGANAEFNTVFTGKGEQEQNPGDVPGDLIISIQIETDPHFERLDENLLFKTTITLAECFTGKKIDIPHYDEIITVDTTSFGIINPNKRYNIKGKGLCGKGDLIIVFKVEIVRAHV